LHRTGKDGCRHQLCGLVQGDELVAKCREHDVLVLDALAEGTQRRRQAGRFALQPHLHVDDIE